MAEETVYEVITEAGPVPLVRQNAARWSCDPAEPVCGVARAILSHNDSPDDRWRLQLFRQIGGAKICTYIAEAESVEGEYAPLPPSPYNLPDQPPVTVRVSDLPAHQARLIASADPVIRRQAMAVAYRHKLQDARQSLQEPRQGTGRGVVVCGGGAYFAGAYVLVKLLRHLGCTLPVELWHAQGETVPDVGLDVTAREAAPGVTGFSLKPHSVLRSGFEDVLYLDSDCYPVEDPSFLFDQIRHRRTGAVFWPDRPGASHWPKPEAWTLLGLEPRDDVAFESGQFLVNRQTHWQALALTDWMCAAENKDFYMGLPGVWGDKDLFHFALRLTGGDYCMVEKPHEIRGPAILQHWGEAVLFQHRVHDKFSLADDKRGHKIFSHASRQAASRNQFDPSLAHEAFCFAALYDLRTRIKPERPEQELELEARFAADLADQPEFANVLVDRPRGFQDHHQLLCWGNHAARLDQAPCWWRAHGSVILLESPAGQAVLHRDGQGNWVGFGPRGQWTVVP